MPDEHRYLIVNADDLGLSAGINQGIAQAHEHGIVTSASLMVRWPDSAAAGTYAADHPELSVGLHLDLGEWTFRDGTWLPLYQVAPADDSTAVCEEARRQLETFRRLVGKDPTHLDAHQHCHREDPARSTLLTMGQELQVPVRLYSDNLTYCGDFYGQDEYNDYLPGALTFEALSAIVRGLPPGTTELGCHPGYSADLSNPYCLEREEELRVLCDPRLRDLLRQENVGLRSFHNFQGQAS